MLTKLRQKDIAAAVAEPAEQYGPGSASYSPEQTPGLDRLGLPDTSTQPEDPNLSTQQVSPGFIPRPPNPSVTGQPGISKAFGWSTGILPSRARRMRFQGETLVVPSMGVHPAVGPVGFSARQQRLDSGVKALVDQWLPSQQEINEQFTTSAVANRNRNPLGNFEATLPRSPSAEG